MTAWRTLAMTALLVTACGAPSGSGASSQSCGLSPDALDQFVQVPSGSFVKGRDPVYPEEAPTLQLYIDGFELLSHEVTNAEFARFVNATGYITDAERSAAAGGEAAGSAVFRSTDGSVTQTPWKLVAGATWKSPEGPDSDIAERDQHPVVHISLADAQAYATWAGGRLPTEAEWEYAASLGLPDPTRASSGAYDDDDTPIANTWQGIFPFSNTADDGFTGTSPVGCFGADLIGAYDMIGNVWEWTDTPYSPGTHTIKGGSYLCADNFCRRYRPAARQPEEIDFSSNHIGFRIVREVVSTE